MRGAELISQLAPIPWEPSYFLTPDTLALLEAAGVHAGHDIEVTDAWRSYVEQKGYWDAYQWYLRGGPWAAVASNPDTGQRNHMRGAAVDIKNRADRAAMLAAGFTADPDEWWHFNNPAWRTMPIIPTNTTTASSAATPITNKKDEDDDMAAAVLLRATNGTLYLAPDDGDLIELKDMDEAQSLIASGAVRPGAKNPDGSVKSWWIQTPDGTIIDRRKRIASRKRAQIAAGK